MSKVTKHPPIHDDSAWLIYLGVALLTLAGLLWQVAGSPLAGGADTDATGLALVATFSALTGAVSTIAGIAVVVVGWQLNRKQEPGKHAGRPLPVSAAPATHQPLHRRG